MDLSTELNSLRDDQGLTLREISDDRPALVALLRHTGCTFCRQAMGDLAASRDEIARRGFAIVVNGMSPTTEEMRRLGERFGLREVSWIADPERLAYGALEIGRGRAWQLFGARVIWAGLRAALRGYGIGRPVGDPMQMPGTVVIHRGVVVRRYVHLTAADRADYSRLTCSIESRS